MPMFDHHVRPLASRATFQRRLVSSGRLAIALVAGSLGIGMAGYAVFEGLGFVDAFLNASMILSGMGPLHNPATVGGKIFAGIYALYSGFAVLVIAAVLIAPVVHRIFHRFHIEEAGDGSDAAKPRVKE
jgi:hypothetical protein